MDQAIASTVSASPTRAQLRKKYGVLMTALVVGADVQVLSKAMNFDERFSKPGTPEYVEAKSWVILDKASGKLYRANTYNGNLGDRVDITAAHNSEAIPTDDKVLKRKLKGYTPVTDLSTVPFISVAAPIAPTEPPVIPPVEETKTGEQTNTAPVVEESTPEQPARRGRRNS